MGREPKHGFVGWLEFKQKIAMKSESKQTHLSKSDNYKNSSETFLLSAPTLPIDAAKIRPRPHPVLPNMYHHETE